MKVRVLLDWNMFTGPGRGLKVGPRAGCGRRGGWSSSWRGRWRGWGAPPPWAGPAPPGDPAPVARPAWPSPESKYFCPLPSLFCRKADWPPPPGRPPRAGNFDLSFCSSVFSMSMTFCGGGGMAAVSLSLSTSPTSS